MGQDKGELIQRQPGEGVHAGLWRQQNSSSGLARCWCCCGRSPVPALLVSFAHARHTPETHFQDRIWANQQQAMMREGKCNSWL